MAVSRVIFKKPKVVYKDLRKDGVVGLAYNDKTEDKLGTIEIDPKQTDRELFLTSFHEILHIMTPDLTEKQVVRLEKRFGKSLWNTVCRLRRKWKAQSHLPSS
jgi:hypothetical protein